MNETITTITINQLNNDYLSEISSQIDKATTLLNVIIGGHFEISEKALRADKNLALEYERSYAEIQMLLCILDDYVWSVKDKINTALDCEIIPDKATA